MTATFESIDTHHFFIYGSRGVAKAADRGHIHLRPFSRQGFLTDLSRCSGVVCNAGFELVSEALHIGKKVLVKPLQGQLEQLSNALAISRLKIGDVMSRLDPQQIEQWLLPWISRYQSIATLSGHPFQFDESERSSSEQGDNQRVQGSLGSVPLAGWDRAGGMISIV